MTETIPAQLQLFGAISEFVSRSYAPVPQVQTIYARSNGGELNFYVFTSEQEYDDALMDRLLSQEYTVLNQYQDIDIAFRYIPSAVYPRHEEVVGQVAQKIFQR